MNEVFKQIQKDLSRFDKKGVDEALNLIKKLFDAPDSLTPLEMFHIGTTCEYLRQMAPINYTLGYGSDIMKQVLKVNKTIKPNEQEKSKGTQS